MQWARRNLNSNAIWIHIYRFRVLLQDRFSFSISSYSYLAKVCDSNLQHIPSIYWDSSEECCTHIKAFNDSCIINCCTSLFSVHTHSVRPFTLSEFYSIHNFPEFRYIWDKMVDGAGKFKRNEFFVQMMALNSSLDWMKKVPTVSKIFSFRMIFSKNLQRLQFSPNVCL